MWFKGNNIEGEEVVTRKVPKEVVTEQNVLKKVVPEEVVPEDIIENIEHLDKNWKQIARHMYMMITSAVKFM